ncbi:MAG: magnesium transporter CorA family protein [Comamonadaceae bacterium]|nr:magnesium transporter CorA family protein [Comamonadaceae bacterium]
MIPAFRVSHLQPGQGVRELDALPSAPPAHGFYWLACTRSALGAALGPLQAALQAVTGQQLVDLHVSDLLNAQRPSGYDYTQHYDLLVFRRLTASTTPAQPPASEPARRGGPPVLRRIDTSPLGFALFDQLLLSVHPEDCVVREAYAAKLLAAQPTDPRERLPSAGGAGARLPASSADLMLRTLGHIVDGFLELRRELSRQLDHWQSELLLPRTRFTNWSALLDARLALHELDDVCEDQRSAVQDWIEALADWQPPAHAQALRELDLLKVRSRDLLEHIERVAHHMRRLESSTETAVQMHFSVQSNRTNDIMRTLTAVTAVFLPLNLVAGIFGMNFEGLPLIHRHNGFWWALASMAGMALALVLLFWRKRYLARSER